MENEILDIINKTESEDISIYVHIPFCESRCYYCDFYSSVINEDNVKEYFKYLHKELELYRNFLKSKKVDSLFIGGGTPSSVNSQYIKELIEKIKSMTSLENSEITIEVNPNSLTENKLKDYIEAGINRYSMGAQSFNEKILKTIGRIHKKEDIIKAAELFRKYNIENFSLDLMSSLPYQKMDDIIEALEMISVLNPAHVSFYSLIIEEGTMMQKIYDNNRDIFPDEEEDRRMYHYIVNTLSTMGYSQYEVSNFAKKGFESRHNTRYWELNNYIGLGASAHSNIDNTRYSCVNSVKAYNESLSSDKCPWDFFETLDKKDRINEFMIMGIRMNKGIDLDYGSKKFNTDLNEYYKYEISKNVKNSLLLKEGNIIKLTEKGFDLSNQVEIDFIKI